MRLAYVCMDPGIPWDGTKGASVHLRAITGALRAAGATVEVFVARCDGPPPEGVTLVAPRGGKGAARELALFAAGCALAERLRARGPFAGLVERLALFSGGGAAYARAAGIPHLIEANAPLWEEAKRYRKLALAGAAEGLALDVLRGADRVLAVSPALAERLEACGVPAARLEVLPNAVERAAFEAARPAPRPAGLEDRPLLLFHGSLKPWHGLEFLLAALEEARDPRRPVLLVAGTGPLASLVEEAAERAPERVRALGAVPHAEIPGLLLAADLVCAPYPPEAPDYFCPLKVLEARALQRPLLAARVRPVIDHLGPGDRAFLFEPGNRRDFARALAAALDAWEAAGRPAGAAAAPEIPDELTWEARARRVLRALAARAEAAP